MYRMPVGQETHVFEDLATLMARATPLRSGDVLAGLAATSAAERVAAQCALADVPLTHFLNDAVVPYEADDVTRLIIDTHDAAAFAPVAHLTVGGLRDWLLADSTDTAVLSALAPGLTPEMAAAVSKIMRLQDLMLVAAQVQRGHALSQHHRPAGALSVRLQPNHPTDDPRGIAASMLDGLLLGAGDAVIGINPATDSPDSAHALLRLLDEVRSKLAHPDADLRAGACDHHAGRDGARRAGGPGVPVDRRHRGRQPQLRRQPGAAAGGARGRAVAGARHRRRQRHVFRDRPGQRAVGRRAPRRRPADAARRAPMRWRAHFKPLLVNTVVGFIGPEYLYDGKQIIRAGLEDHFCGKLLGLPMGCDVCYTNHAEADQDDMDALLTLLGAAGVNFVMGVPGADDIMLDYQSTSFHDALAVRELLGKRPAPEFEAWLAAQGLSDAQGRVRPDAVPRAACGNCWANRHERRQACRQARLTTSAEVAAMWAALRPLTAARIGLPRTGASLGTPALLDFRLAHARARDAVGAALDSRRLVGRPGSSCGQPALVCRSAAADRRSYLMRPDLGRQLDEASLALLQSSAVAAAGWPSCWPTACRRRPRKAMPCRCCRPCCRLLAAQGWALAPVVLLHNGRVAAGRRGGARAAGRARCWC